MRYLIYKVTNLINGKYYIGRHSTNNYNDSYMGSGIGMWNHNTLSWKKSLGKQISRGSLKGFQVNMLQEVK